MRTLSPHRMTPVLCSAMVSVLVMLSIGARRSGSNAPDDGLPIGAIIAFAGDSIPVGYLACDGSFYRQADYPDLYRMIGVKHGDGVTPLGRSGAGQRNGDGYFNVPDCRGRFLRGVDSMRAATGAAGRDPGPRTAPFDTTMVAIGIGAVEEGRTAMPNRPFVADTGGKHPHRLAVARVGASGNQTNVPVRWDAGSSDIVYTEHIDPHKHPIVGGDTETRPRNIAVGYLIKARRTQ